MRLPTGSTVTFLFTDIEGSTRLERAVGSAAWATIVARHDGLLRAAIEKHGGVVVKTEGDAFFAAFERPGVAASAAVAAQRAVTAEAWPQDVALRVRMGLHLGEGRLRQGGPPGAPEDYVGIDVNYAARITAVGNGGQIVLSEAFVAAIGPGLADSAELGDVELADEGLRAVKDFEEPARLYRLEVAGAADDARPLRTIEAPSNLPGEVTDLVGREAEIDLLRGVLATNRIVTLTGPGGSGKTRLALGVARETGREDRGQPSTGVHSLPDRTWARSLLTQGRAPLPTPLSRLQPAASAPAFWPRWERRRDRCSCSTAGRHGTR